MCVFVLESRLVDDKIVSTYEGPIEFFGRVCLIITRPHAAKPDKNYE